MTSQTSPGASPLPTAKPEDARGSVRVRVSWRIRIAAADKSVQEGRIFDISSGGVGAMCDRTLPVGAEVHLAIALPNTEATGFEALTCRAKVVFATFSSGACRIGLQFGDLTATQKSRLAAAMQRTQATQSR